MLDITEMEKLKRIYIEISNICNLQCTFCPVVERDKNIMDSPSFEGILAKVAPFSEEICLHLMGEPLAHPEFPHILEIAAKFGVQLNLTTNALLLSKYEDLLLSYNNIKQINFSVHSYKDNFKNKPLAPYLIELITFSERAIKERPDLYINFRLWTMDEKNEDVTRDNLEVIELINQYFHTNLTDTVDVGFRKNKKIEGRVYLHFDSRFTWPSPNLPKLSEVGTCQGVQSQLGIHADGSVVPCCLDKEATILLGNIKNQSLEDIYQSARTQAMFQGFQKGQLVEDLCQKCPFVSRFRKKAERLTHQNKKTLKK